MKVKKIEQADKQYVKQQKNNLKTFLKLAKYDVIPSVIAGSVTSSLLVNTYSSSGMVDAMLFGGISGLSFILAVNGVITGVKDSKKTREKMKMQLEEFEEAENDKGISK